MKFYKSLNTTVRFTIYTIAIMLIMAIFTSLICAGWYSFLDKEANKESSNCSDEYFTEDETIYLGKYYIIPYCGCPECCGMWGIGRPVSCDGSEIVYTANQSVATEGITVAANPEVFPYGAKLIIDGHEYTVQDEGSNKSTIYLYFESHDDAEKHGIKVKDVYTY